jgi:hypothetical protein
MGDSHARERPHSPTRLPVLWWCPRQGEVRKRCPVPTCPRAARSATVAVLCEDHCMSAFHRKMDRPKQEESWPTRCRLRARVEDSGTVRRRALASAAGPGLRRNDDQTARDFGTAIARDCRSSRRWLCPAAVRLEHRGVAQRAQRKECLRRVSFPPPRRPDRTCSPPVDRPAEEQEFGGFRWAAVHFGRGRKP